MDGGGGWRWWLAQQSDGCVIMGKSDVWGENVG